MSRRDSMQWQQLTKRRLDRDFYARPVLRVARDCLGKILVHRTADGLTSGTIVEAEAYRGPEDRAAHSYGGRRTERTEAMFGRAGHAYVFLIYGLHHHFNVVAGQEGQPHAVLIRAIEPLTGVELMASRRNMSTDRKELTNGPGKLAQALGIDLGHYGKDLCSGDLFLADGPRVRATRSPRIGIDYAGEWAKRPWRFFVAGNRYVSTTRRGVRVNLEPA
jgi:DNA-3-methyladenine glycosylase